MRIHTISLCKLIRILEDINNGSTLELKVEERTQLTPSTSAILQSQDKLAVEVIKTASTIRESTTSPR